TRKPSGAARSKPRSPPEPIKIGLYETRGSSVELRRMREEPPESALFGVAFLWTALFRRGAAASGDVRPVHDRA
ncbi:hypothetical protein ABZ770_43615, partial [Streptomyces sp. NPDC006654]